MKLKIEYVDINSIKPYEKNAKLHPAEQVNEAIAKMKQTDIYKNYENEYNKNSNGNALYLVVLEWLMQRM